MLGKACKKLEVYNNDGSGITTYEYTYMDSDEKVFYLRDSSGVSTWCLYYDFRLNVGDSFTLNCDRVAGGDNLVMTVKGIDSIFLGGTWRKVFDYEGGDGLVVEWSGEVIEGIGHTRSMFPTYDGELAPTSLRCYSDPVVGLYKSKYPTEWADSCDHSYTLSTVVTQKEYFQIFTSRGSPRGITIFGTNKQATIKLYNISGALVQEAIIKPSSVARFTYLEHGAYLIQVVQEGKMVKAEMVVVN